MFLQKYHKIDVILDIAPSYYTWPILTRGRQQGVMTPPPAFVTYVCENFYGRPCSY